MKAVSDLLTYWFIMGKGNLSALNSWIVRYNFSQVSDMVSLYYTLRKNRYTLKATTTIMTSIKLY